MPYELDGSHILNATGIPDVKFAGCKYRPECSRGQASIGTHTMPFRVFAPDGSPIGDVEYVDEVIELARQSPPGR